MTDELAPTLLNVACIDGRWCWMERIPAPRRRWWHRGPIVGETFRAGATIDNRDLERLLFADAYREAVQPQPRQPNRAERRAAAKAQR